MQCSVSDRSGLQEFSRGGPTHATSILVIREPHTDMNDSGVLNAAIILAFRFESYVSLLSPVRGSKNRCRGEGGCDSPSLL